MHYFCHGTCEEMLFSKRERDLPAPAFSGNLLASDQGRLTVFARPWSSSLLTFINKTSNESSKLKAADFSQMAFLKSTALFFPPKVIICVINWLFLACACFSADVNKGRTWDPPPHRHKSQPDVPGHRHFPLWLPLSFLQRLILLFLVLCYWELNWGPCAY
jgi:hypothetical protein